MCCVVCPSPSRLSVIQVTIGVTKFVNFDVKTFVLLGIYSLKITLPLNYAVTLSVARFFKGL
jgi:hypothetical protein